MRKQLYLLYLLLLSVQLAIAQTARYEYWLDNDYNARVTSTNVSEDVTLDVDVSSKKPGLHYFSFRAQSTNGQWGGMSRYYFFIRESADDGGYMTKYEYWLDKDYEHRTIVNGEASEIPLTLDLSSLRPGLHYFNIRAQGRTGQWGALSRYIVYLSEALSNVNLSTVEYMIDNDSTTVQSQQVNGNTIVITADISRLSEGTHTINIEGITNNYTRCLLGSYEFVYDDIPRPEALFENGVLTVGGSTTMTEAVEYVGGQSVVVEKVAAVVWNSSAELTNSDLQGITNPNLLVYVNEARLAPSNVQNVVINGLAREIVLTDVQDGNNDWYAPQAFVAERISYTHNFTQSTSKGTSRGWESIALPFDVQTIQHESKGAIAPFNNSASNKHFWLRRLTDNGLQAATNIEANTPYIISMPNSEEYTSDYNLNGRVTFSAQNIDVPATTTKVLALADSSIVMVPAMQRQSRSSSVWALNVGEVRGQYFEGSVFERDYRTVRPFEAYTIHRQENGQPAPRYVPIQEIAGVTGIETIDREPLTLNQWYDMQGRKLEGKPARKGVYISNGKKVVVK